MVTVPAMLPIYQRLGMDPLILTCTTAMAAGTMNILPWGGPATRAATALQVGVGELFTPLVVPTLAGVSMVFVLAAWIGARAAAPPCSMLRPLTTMPRRSAAPAAILLVQRGADRRHARRPGRRGPAAAGGLPRRVRDCLAGELPGRARPARASGSAWPRRDGHGHHRARRRPVCRHHDAAPACSPRWRATSSASCRRALLRHLPALLAVVSMPLSLAFDPDSFYFGVLPVLATASHSAGGSAIDVGRAALVGQMTTGFPVSPLDARDVPARRPCGCGSRGSPAAVDPIPVRDQPGHGGSGLADGRDSVVAKMYGTP